MSTPTTEFARRIGDIEIDEDHEQALARMAAEVVCAEDRTPTLDERAFIDAFTPRVETPLEELIKEEIEAGDWKDIPPEVAQTLLMITQALTLQGEGREAQQSFALLRLAGFLGLSADQARRADAYAKEFVVERSLTRLYADGPPIPPKRADLLVRLANIGADDEVVRRWEDEVRRLAPTHAVSEAHTESIRHERHDKFMERNDPTTAPVGPGVFGGS